MSTVPLSYTKFSGPLEMVDIINRLQYQLRLVELLHEADFELDGRIRAMYVPLQRHLIHMERLYDAVYGEVLSDWIQIDLEKVHVDLELVSYATILLHESFESITQGISDIAGVDVRDILDELPSENMFGTGVSESFN